MNVKLSDKKTVIIADGAFPVHHVPVQALSEADFIVCCDGAASALAESGLEPGVIIGDLDSLGEELTNRYRDRLVSDTDQEINDLTKAVRWCRSHGAEEVAIVGATGKREDHTLGNISLLADYGKLLTVKLLTDTGIMFPIFESCKIPTIPGQRVSVFSLDSDTEVTTEGLKYPINRLKLRSWWTATLNEALGHSITLTLTHPSAQLIIYLGHE